MQFLSEPTQDFFTYSHPKEICWIIYKILWLFQPIPKIYANVISTNHPCQVWFFNMLKRNICLKILKPPTSHQWHPSTCLASKNDSRAERRALSQRSAQPDWATEFSLERARLNGSKKQGTMRSEDVFRCFWGHKKVSGWILGLPLDEESSLCLYKYLFKQSWDTPKMIRNIHAYLQVSQKNGVPPNPPKRYFGIEAHGFADPSL